MRIFSVLSKEAILIILVKNASVYNFPVVLPILGNGRG